MSELRLLAESDLDWVAAAVDLVTRCAGQPWRIALERLDDLQRADQPTAPRRFSAVVGALQRVTSSGRARHARAAREARALVLGKPALSPEARTDRIRTAADELGITPAALETLLWADLPRERAVELPGGRPDDLEVTALANIALIQRALRRAQSLTLRVHDQDAGGFLRAAVQRGLLASACIGTSGESVIDIVGPLALIHRTSVYGRALAELAPLLGELSRFSLELHVETAYSMFTTHVVSPVLLPKPPARLVAAPYPVARLAKQLATLGLAVDPMPDVLVTGRDPGSPILCPDLAVGFAGQRVYIELVGFFTPGHLERKRASYAAARASVVFCVDAAAGLDHVPDDVLLFHKHVDPGALVAKLGSGGEI